MITNNGWNQETPQLQSYRLLLFSKSRIIWLGLRPNPTQKASKTRKKGGIHLQIWRNICYLRNIKHILRQEGEMDASSIKWMFEELKVLTLERFSEEKGCSKRTVQRQFAKLPVLRSYNKSSRYYTLSGIFGFNAEGIFILKFCSGEQDVRRKGLRKSTATCSCANLKKCDHTAGKSPPKRRNW